MPTFWCSGGLWAESELYREAVYEYDGYDGTKENYEDIFYNKLEEEVTRIPEFISESQNLLVNEGDTIKLDCQVDKFGRHCNNSTMHSVKRLQEEVL